MRTVIKSFALFVLTVLLMGAEGGCENTQSSRDKGSERQESTMQKAMSKVPTPVVNNFQTRETVSKWMNRMDKPNKTFYVYLLADTGQTIGYYVAQTRPVSICATMTPPDRVDRVRGQPDTQVVSSPALDGVYYGEGACNGVYFFDAETDAYVEISGLNYFVSDHPLSVEAEPIQVTKDE